MFKANPALPQVKHDIHQTSVMVDKSLAVGEALTTGLCDARTKTSSHAKWRPASVPTSEGLKARHECAAKVSDRYKTLT